MSQESRIAPDSEDHVVCGKKDFSNKNICDDEMTETMLLTCIEMDISTVYTHFYLL